ncbi:MAG: DUF4328 domain-containing protein [Novosphingobium sp.]
MAEQRDFQARLASLRTRSVVAQAFIGLFLLVAALVALSAALLSWREFRSANSTYMVVGPAMVVWLALLGIPALAAFCAWVWRAHANLHADGREGLNFSPAWATFSTLIPVANLVVPMQAMRELWNRSHGEESWGARYTVGLVTSWWTCFVAGALVQGALLFVVAFDLATNIAVLTPPGVNALIHALSAVLLIAAGFLLIRIIRKITAAQHDVTHVGNTFA